MSQHKPTSAVALFMRKVSVFVLSEFCVLFFLFYKMVHVISCGGAKPPSLLVVHYLLNFVINREKGSLLMALYMCSKFFYTFYKQLLPHISLRIVL